MNVDYIVRLVKGHKALHGDAKDKEILTKVSRMANASPPLYSKRDLIEAFLGSFTLDEDGGTQWGAILEVAKRAEIDEIVSAEHLRADAAKSFVARTLERGHLSMNGTEILKIPPPISRFAKSGKGESHVERKAHVIAKFKVYLERFLGV